MQIVNPPQPVEPAEYNRAIDAYCSRVLAVAGVRSVYTMGSVKAPGLSDLDLIVVVDDDLDPELSAGLSVRGIDDRLFIHGPVVIPVSMAADLHFLLYATDVTRIHGTDRLPAFSELDDEAATSLRFAYLVDFLESRQIQYSHAISVGQIDQRAWMARLWSLTHSERLLTDTGLTLELGDQHVLSRIRELRRNWMASGSISSSEFTGVFQESIHTSRNILLSALRYLHGSRARAPRTGVSAYDGNKIITFDSSVPLCEYKTLRLPGLGPIHVAKWHWWYAEHLDCYGLLSNKAGPPGSIEVSAHFRKRAAVVKRHWSWLETSCPRAGSMSGYLGLRPRKANTRKAKARAAVVAGVAKASMTFGLRR